MSAHLILLVDDEKNITELASIYLKREGLSTFSVQDGLSALEAVEKLYPFLMVLDLMLPGLDGLEVCRRIRSANNKLPILMLTARDEDVDKIIGFELGADDYLTKPFNPRELVARVKAVLRRSENVNYGDDKVITIADLKIDPGKREVTCQGQFINLRTQEFEVLWVFAQYKGLVFNRDRLLSLDWGYAYFGNTRTVDAHVAQLRRKLKKSSVRIETITGIGYKPAE